MKRELTGRHVLAIFGSGFAVIILVNLVLAVQAVRTFPGLETANSYVASQRFEAERTAQDALGWTVGLDYDGSVLTLAVDDAAGRVRPEIVSAVLGRATHTGADVRPDFAWTGSAMAAPVALAPGNWNLRLEARAEDGTTFRRRLVLRVPR